MARISRSQSFHIRSSILRLHDQALDRRKAKALIMNASVRYLPRKLRACVEAGLARHLKTDFLRITVSLAAWVYSATDTLALASDPDIRRARTLMGRASRRSCQNLHDSPLLASTYRCSTTKRLVELHPELLPIIEHVCNDAPEPDQKKLRRALLRSGWPLRYRDGAK